MAEKLSNAERRKRFLKELARLDKTLSPEEREDRRGQSFAKRFFLDAPKDVMGTAMDREGISGAIPGMGGGDISPEARAKEIFDAGRKRRTKEKKDAKRRAKNRARAKANPSLLKGGSNFSKGGLASAAKTIAGKTTRSRNKTKPRGVGVAMKGYGKALR